MTIARALIAFTLLSILSGCQAEPDVPEHLVGTWKTRAPQYADRFVEFTMDSLIFGTGGDSADSYMITKIEEVDDGLQTLYTISYTIPEGQEFRLSFYHDLSKGGVIWFKNQDHLIWTKERG